MPRTKFSKILASLYHLAFVGLLLCSAPFSHGGETFFTNEDNEDNLATGTSDNDLDQVISATSVNHPIEFNIEVQGAGTNTLPALLLIDAEDIDEEEGDVVTVSFNNTVLGTLAGVGDESTHYVFEIDTGTNPILTGNNLVEVTVAEPRTTRIISGQLIIDGGDDDTSEINTISIESISENAGTLSMDVQTSIDMIRDGRYTVEVNLVGPTGTMFDTSSLTFDGAGGQSQTDSHTLEYPISAADGDYILQAYLFVQSSSFERFEDYQTSSFRHAENDGPDQLPAHPNFSTLSVVNPSIVANGSSTTLVTLQGVDVRSINTSVSGQTVTFASDVGAFGNTIDGGDGTYSAIYTAPSSSGIANISARIDGRDVADTATINLVPGEPTIERSTLSASLDSISANGTDVSILTVQLTDANNNDLVSGGDNVVISSDLGSLSATIDNGDGTYSASLSSIASGTANISATLDGASIASTRQVEITPLPASMQDTTISLSPDILIANGETISTIFVRAINELGIPLTEGGSQVVIRASLGTVSVASDLNDGSYSATFTSPTSAGISVISATFDGEDVLDTALITLNPGPLVANGGDITTQDDTIAADGIASTTITVRGNDAFGNRVNAGGASVTLSTDFGTLSEVSDMGDGRYTATLFPSTVTGTAIIRGAIEGVALSDTAVVQFLPGPANAANSQLSVGTAQLTANGTDTTLVTLRAFDALDNALISGGDTPVISVTSGTLSSVSDLGNGSYQALFTAPEEAGSATVTATLNGEALPTSLEITLVPGEADIRTSQITSAREQIVADGATQTLITLQAYDAQGNIIDQGGEDVSFSSTLGSLGSVNDLGDGRYQTVLTSGTEIGTAIISASLNNQALNDTTSVEMMARPTVNEIASPSSTPSISGTYPAMTGASLLVSVNNVIYSEGDGNLITSGSDWALNIPAGNEIPDGEYEVVATVTDIDSQVSTDNTNNELLVDTVFPTISLDILRPADSDNTLSYTISGRCTETIDIISITVTDQNSDSVQQSNVACEASFTNEGRFNSTLNLRPLANGSINIIAQIVDRAGNLSMDRDSISKDTCSPDNTVAICDSDNDGITNGVEIEFGLDPDSYDSDGDGISDLEEISDDGTSLVDTDKDGIPDALDVDSDNDGILDSVEVGASPTNPQDSDQDGIHDYQDRDSDNDRIPDIVENSFLSKDFDEDSIPNYLDLDSDGDGLPDSVENGVATHLDSDRDGIDNAFDVDLQGGEDENQDGIDDAITIVDSDGDGRFNTFDLDSDNDGMSDEQEAGLDASQDADGDGINDQYDVDSLGGSDDDNDGVTDTILPPNHDNDIFPDYVDLDSDNDGLSDVLESGGIDLSPVDSQHDVPETPTTNPVDSDSDGIPDHLDRESGDSTNDRSAPFDLGSLAIPQSDIDDDGQIDPGPDLDQDGIIDSADEDPANFGSPTDRDSDAVLNINDLDWDNDGIPNIIEGDFSIDSDSDGQPDLIDLDSDNDGLTDLREAAHGLVDFDNDGMIDTLVDSNSDGLDDSISTSYDVVDSDSDGLADFRDLDSDGDGVTDLQEANLPGADLSAIDSDGNGMVDEMGTSFGLSSQIFSTLIDTDEDGIENFLDVDSDNDGFSDGAENGDFNGNGVIDLAENDQASINTAERGSGGSVDFFSAILLALTAFSVTICRRVNKLSVLPSVLLAIIITSSAIPESVLAEPVEFDNDEQCARVFHFSDTDESDFNACWYAALGTGFSYLSPNGSSNGWTVDEEFGFGLSAIAGRRVSENLAIEVSYTDLGESGLGNTNPTLSNTIDAAIEYRSPSAMLIYIQPHDTLDHYFKIGPSWIKTKANDTRIGFSKQSDVQIAWGLGTRYKLSNSPWFIGLDFTNYSKDARFASLQIGRHFGFKPSSPKPPASIIQTPYENLRLQLDSDQDGIKDKYDLCPLSEKGVEVDETGCCTEKAGCIRVQ